MREGSKRDLARRLRRDLTEHERRLWYLLRDRRFSGTKFRRQLPIGPYVADFASVSHKLVIEIDGGQHANSAKDADRDAYLRAQGWTILRFWNNEVMENREGVLMTIAENITRSSPLTRSPSATRPLPPELGCSRVQFFNCQVG
jgi:very-short-patch-repair endonuclease